MTLATIRFHLPADAIERISFAYGPLLETVYSLHVLVEPQRHPLHHPWVRRMRALPASLRQEMTACGFAFGAAPPGLGTALPDPLGRFPTDTSESFSDAVAALRKLPIETATAAFADVLAIAERHRPPTDPALRMAREDQLAFVERLCRLLEGYWAAAFEREWQRLEPQLAESVAEAGRLLLTGGLSAFVQTLGPRIRTHSDGQRIELDVSCAPQWGSAAEQADTDVTVTGGFTFVPSAFSWPHIWYGVDASWPLGMTYHAPFVSRQVRRRVPPVELVRFLRACGDDVRLPALRWIADRPRSTQELAPLIGISESTLSKHLRHLTEAGVLEPRRDGYYVLYHLRRDHLASLMGGLLAYLSPDESDGRTSGADRGMYDGA
jgi:DNA-binding transcriptional ArsR family regulator